MSTNNSITFEEVEKLFKNLNLPIEDAGEQDNVSDIENRSFNIKDDTISTSQTIFCDIQALKQ